MSLGTSSASLACAAPRAVLGRKKKEGAGPLLVRVIGAPENSEGGRALLGVIIATGEMCFIHLAGRGRCAAQFQPGQTLPCTPGGQTRVVFHD